MPAAEPPYIDVARRRQSARRFVVLTIAAMTATLGGCAGMGLPFADVDRTTTASIPGSHPVLASATFIDRVDPSDWQSIRKTIAAAPNAATTGIEWTNPATGTTGTVAVAAAKTPKNGLSCRTFATTISDARGIRRYRGDACLSGGGMLTLRDVAADDATIS